MGKKKGQDGTKRNKQTEKALKKSLKRADKDEADEIAKIVEVINKDTNMIPSSTIEITPSNPIPPRASGTFIYTGNSFIFFGGEYFDTKSCIGYGDTYKYTPGKETEWKKLTNGPSPQPRVAQASCIHNDQIYIFGGEYSTMTQFMHYGDMWKLTPKTLLWEKIPFSGTCPTPRSGHRMISIRNLIVLFGGFYETSRDCRYYNDLYIFNPQTNTWSKVNFTSGTRLPDPRSGFIIGSNNNGITIAGGYSKLKDSDTGAQGQTFREIWYLDMTPVFDEKSKGKGSPVWNKLTTKFLSRSSIASCVHKESIYLFGGVSDIDDGGLVIKRSYFFNDIHVYDMKSKRIKRLSTNDENKEKGKNTNIAYMVSGGMLIEADLDTKALISFNPNQSDIDSLHETVTEIDISAIPGSEGCPIPLPRMNASIAYGEKSLIVTGGTLEIGNRAISFDDIWSFNPKTLTWKVLYIGTYYESFSIDKSAISSDTSSDDDSLSENDVDYDSDISYSSESEGLPVLV